jgi:hypothetical protein
MAAARHSFKYRKRKTAWRGRRCGHLLASGAGVFHICHSTKADEHDNGITAGLVERRHGTLYVEKHKFYAALATGGNKPYGGTTYHGRTLRVTLKQNARG